MTIPPGFLDEIRNRMPPSDVIGKRIKVMRAGREFKACCPFHKEKTPSFTINDQKQFYHCFGCGVHGDVIKFVQDYDNLSFMDAVKMLAAQAGLQMPEMDARAVERAEEKKDLFALMEAATGWFQAQLFDPAHQGVLDYVRGRGINDESMAVFQIGYAPGDMDGLRKAMLAQGFDVRQMVEAGLLKPSQKGGEPYAFFRDRVMFPVCDRRGRVVAFGGRILPDHLRPADRGDFTPPKYINTSDTPLFDKGRLVYAEHLARAAARDGHTLLVTEGYMDVIACHQAGFKGAVAPMGTALTEDQIALLWVMTPQEEKVPVLCFDGDSAGRKAAARACERALPLLKAGCSVRFAFLPDGEDPDSLIKAAGRERFTQILKASLSLFDFLWAVHTAGRKFETPEARAGLSKTLEQQVRHIADREVQSYYRALVREKISKTFFRRPERDRAGKNFGKKAMGMKMRAPSFAHLRGLLAAVVNHPHIYEAVEECFSGLVLPEERHDLLRQNVINALSAEPDLDAGGLKTYLMEAGFEQELHDILSESVYVHASFAAPGADKEMVLPQWQTFFENLQARQANERIRQELKQAVQASNQEDEERLRAVIKMQSGTFSS